MWKDLSIKEKAELIKLYTHNGIYDINDMQKHYNTFDGGGPIKKNTKDTAIEIAPFNVGSAPQDFVVEEHDEVSSPILPPKRTVEEIGPKKLTVDDYFEDDYHYKYQPMNALAPNKRSFAAMNPNVMQGVKNFYNDDYQYRVQRELSNAGITNPNDVPNQADVNVNFNNIGIQEWTPSDFKRFYPNEDIHSTTTGGFTLLGRGTPYIYMNPKNADDMMPTHTTHEFSHALANSLGLDDENGVVSKKSRELLEKAYPSFDQKKGNRSREQRAVNTQLREYLYKKSGGKSKEALDNYIDNITLDDYKKAVEGAKTSYLTPQMLNNTNLDAVKDALKNVAYNPVLNGTEYTNYAANGGFLNQYGNGGYIPSKSIKNRITTWEGSSMKTNRPFSEEAQAFNRYLPKEALSRLSQEQLDGLFSYSYNVGSGNFNRRVVPVLKKYLAGKASVQDVQKSMWAGKDSQLRGLAKRRQVERQMFGGVPYAPMTMNNSPRTINTSTVRTVDRPTVAASDKVAFNAPMVNTPVNTPLFNTPIFTNGNVYATPIDLSSDIPDYNAEEVINSLFQNTSSNNADSNGMSNLFSLYSNIINNSYE